MKFDLKLNRNPNSLRLLRFLQVLLGIAFTTALLIAVKRWISPAHLALI